MPRPPIASSPQSLPDFCSAPILFALLLVGALTANVMWLSASGPRDWRSYSEGMLLVVWLALVIGVSLCKLRPLLQRLPGYAPYAGVWLLIVLIVGLASVLVGWLDLALLLQMDARPPRRFVGDNVLIAALLGAALLRYFYVVAQWQLRLAAEAQAQVAALQARIRPHFLFNSMNTAAALIRIDTAAAERTLEDLAELFRAALGQDGPGTLGDELALLERYLAIEQLRLGPRLRVTRQLEDLPNQLPLPRLLLQPLLENAVRHGIQPLREGGLIELRGYRRGEHVVIEIANPLGSGERHEDSGHGHGLANVRQRMAYHYGRRGRIEVEHQQGRFVVRLHLPTGAHDARADR
jgi:two-component system sensor histidine kinase AlgZ